jgi:hypothetical protein
MSKHSPPWHWEGPRRLVDANDQPIIDGADDEWWMRDDHAGRLIAAAPVLLEALSDLLGWDNCECSHPACKRGEAATEARALIRRIEGEP